MNKIILIVSAFLILASCNSDSRQKPAKFLDEKEFANLLIDIHLTDAVAEEKAKGEPKIENLLASKGLAQVLKNHNLSRIQFDSIFNYYVKDPEQLNGIYTKVIDELSRKQAELVR